MSAVSASTPPNSSRSSSHPLLSIRSFFPPTGPSSFSPVFTPENSSSELSPYGEEDSSPSLRKKENKRNKRRGKEKAEDEIEVEGEVADRESFVSCVSSSRSASSCSSSSSSPSSSPSSYSSSSSSNRMNESSDSQPGAVRTPLQFSSHSTNVEKKEKEKEKEEEDEEEPGAVKRKRRRSSSGKENNIGRKDVSDLNLHQSESESSSRTLRTWQQPQQKLTQRLNKSHVDELPDSFSFFNTDTTTTRTPIAPSSSTVPLSWSQSASSTSSTVNPVSISVPISSLSALRSSPFPFISSLNNLLPESKQVFETPQRFAVAYTTHKGKAVTQAKGAENAVTHAKQPKNSIPPSSLGPLCFSPSLLTPHALPVSNPPPAPSPCPASVSDVSSSAFVTPISSLATLKTPITTYDNKQTKHKLKLPR